MPGMNWERVQRERREAVDRRADAASKRPTGAFAAKFTSMCRTCDEPIDVGARIVSTLVDAKRVYHHERCLFPDVDRAPDSSLDDGATALAGAIPDGRCHALTKKGAPCGGGAKRGELYCGPHFDQILNGGSPGGQSTSSEPPYDPSYDEPF